MCLTTPGFFSSATRKCIAAPSRPTPPIFRARRAGSAAGETWPCDLGPDLSRGFRALKTWFTIETFGTERLGACIERTCRMARRLETALEASTSFVLRAPVTLNIVCFGVADDPDGDLAREVVMELHESHEAAPSLTILDGTPAIRAAIINHRTHEADIDAFAALLEATLRRARREPRRTRASSGSAQGAGPHAAIAGLTKARGRS